MDSWYGAKMMADERIRDLLREAEISRLVRKAHSGSQELSRAFRPNTQYLSRTPLVYRLGGALISLGRLLQDGAQLHRSHHSGE